MENVVIKFDVKNEDILHTIDLLEKIGQVEKGTADQFRKDSATRMQLAAQNEANLKEQSALQSDINSKLVKTEANLKDVVSTIAGGALTNGIKQMNAEVDKAITKQTSLKTQLRAMKQELQTLPENSKRFNELSLAAAKLEDKIGDVSARVRNLAADGKNLNAIVGVARGIAAGFAVAEGAAGLFGASQEEVQKSLLKVQSAMAILTGLQEIQNLLLEESAAKSVIASAGQALYTFAVGTSTGALKAFRLALLATGVGAIIVLIGALIANWDELTGSIGDSSKALERQKELEERLAKDRAEHIEAEKRNRDEAYRISKEQKDKENNQLISNEEIRIALMGDGLHKELAAQRLAFAIKRTELSENGATEANIEALNRKEINEIRSKYRKIDKDKADAAFDIFIDNLRNRVQNEQDAAAKIKANEEKDIADQKAYKEKQLAALTEANEEYYNHLVSVAKINGEEIEFIEIERLEAQLEIAKKNGQDIIAIEDEIAAAKKAIRDKDSEQLVQNLQAGLNYAKTINKSAADFELNILQDKLNKQQISQSEFDRQSADVKRKSANRDKALAIFDIGLNTSVAVVKMLANPGGAAGLILSIAAGVAGAAQIAAVASKQVPAFAKGVVGLQGPGTETSDSIHARLSRNESVITADGTRKNKTLLQKINAGLINTEAINNAMPSMPGIVIPLPGHSDNAHYDFDYDRLGESIVKANRKSPHESISFDENGFTRRVITETQNITYINKRYSSK